MRGTHVFRKECDGAGVNNYYTASLRQRLKRDFSSQVRMFNLQTPYNSRLLQSASVTAGNMKSSQHQTRRAFAGALNELLDRHGLPASNHGRLQAFAKLVNRPVSTAHRWLSGAGMPDVDDLLLLCDSFTCSLDELLGRCPIGGEQNDPDPATAVTYFSDFGSVVINIPSSFIGDGEAMRPIGVLRVVGREMSGYAEPNDRIFFDLSDTEIESGAVFALRIGSTLMLRRLRIRLDGQIDVLCDNPIFPAEMMPRASFKRVDQADDSGIAVLGRVIAKLNREHH